MSTIGWIFVAVAPCVSIFHFILGKDLILSRRLFASIHGLAAVAMLPLAQSVAALYPGSSATFGIVGLFVIGGISSSSIFFSMAELKIQWRYHVLHIPTVIVISVVFIMSLFALGGH